MNITDYKLNEHGEQILVRTVVDDGNGVTATQTNYDEKGKPVATEQIPAIVDNWVDNSTISVSTNTVQDLQDAMSDPAVNTIAEIKDAISNFASNLLGQ